MLERAFEYAGWLFAAVVWLGAGLLWDRRCHRAARKNAAEFEKADGKSISAWKHFPL